MNIALYPVTNDSISTLYCILVTLLVYYSIMPHLITESVFVLPKSNALVRLTNKLDVCLEDGTRCEVVTSFTPAEPIFLTNVPISPNIARMDPHHLALTASQRFAELVRIDAEPYAKEEVNPNTPIYQESPLCRTKFEIATALIDSRRINSCKRAMRSDVAAYAAVIVIIMEATPPIRHRRIYTERGAIIASILNNGRIIRHRRSTTPPLPDHSETSCWELLKWTFRKK